jgi:hypothetical protein
VADDVAARAEKEARGVATELRAQATRRERLKKALDPRVLFRTNRSATAPTEMDRAA